MNDKKKKLKKKKKTKDKLIDYISRNNKKILEIAKENTFMVVLFVFFIITLFISVYFYNKFDTVQAIVYKFDGSNRIVQHDGATFVRFDEQRIAMTIITDSTCDECAGIVDESIDYIRGKLPTMEIGDTVDISVTGNENYLQEYNASAIPFFLFDSNVKETSFYKLNDNFFDEVGDNIMFYSYNAVDRLPGYYASAPVSEKGFSAGSAKSTVVVSVFIGIDCTLCAVQNKTLDLLRNKYKEDLRIVYYFARQSDKAVRITKGLVCAQEQESFVPYLQHIFARQFAWRKVKDIDATLFSYSKQIRGIGIDKFSECIKQDDAEAFLDNQDKIFDQFGVQTIPTIMIGTTRYDGVQTYKVLTAEVDRILKEKSVKIVTK